MYMYTSVYVSICPGIGRGGDEGKKGRMEKKKSTGKRRNEVFGYMI